MPERLIPSISGARVIEHDGIIEKTVSAEPYPSSVRRELDWYTKARRFHFSSIPRILGLDVDKAKGEETLGTEYVTSVPLHTLSVDEVVQAIDGMMDAFKRIPLIVSAPEVDSILSRIDAHVSVQPLLYDSVSVSRLKEKIEGDGYLYKERSFAHGDFSVDNVLWNEERGAVLIDPIHEANLYSSWMADIAKLIASILMDRALGRRAEEFYALLCEELLSLYSSRSFSIRLLVVYQMIRTVKYREDADRKRVSDLIKSTMEDYRI